MHIGTELVDQSLSRIDNLRGLIFPLTGNYLVQPRSLVCSDGVIGKEEVIKRLYGLFQLIVDLSELFFVHPLFHLFHALGRKLALYLMSELRSGSVQHLLLRMVPVELLEFTYQVNVQNVRILSNKFLQVLKCRAVTLDLYWLIHLAQRVLHDIAFCALHGSLESDIHLLELPLQQLLLKQLQVLKAHLSFLFIIDSKSECLFGQHDIDLFFYQLCLFCFYPGFGDITIGIPTVELWTWVFIKDIKSYFIGCLHLKVNIVANRWILVVNVFGSLWEEDTFGFELLVERALTLKVLTHMVEFLVTLLIEARVQLVNLSAERVEVDDVLVRHFLETVLKIIPLPLN